MNHTPIPWNQFSGRCIGDQYGNLIAKVSTESHLGEGNPDANAAHIVHCVNSHDELVAALEECRSFILHQVASNPRNDAIYNRLSDLLAKVQK